MIMGQSVLFYTKFNYLIINYKKFRRIKNLEQIDNYDTKNLINTVKNRIFSVVNKCDQINNKVQ